MKVVVAGGMGFLGSHVCEMYKKAGEEVVALDNLTKFELKRNWYDSEKAREYNLDYLKNLGVDFIRGDICDYDLVKKVCKDSDYLVNCAAQPAMTISIENPRLDKDTNIDGLFNLLEAARLYDIPFSHCSSIHVYGNNLNHELYKNKSRFLHPLSAVKESHPILDGELSPLHVTKRVGELYCRSFNEMYGLKTLCLRLSGIYGPRQFGGEDHGWVANFTIRTIMDKPIKVFDTDLQVRDILYVKDAASVFDCFYDKQVSGIYNCGGGSASAISIGECLSLLSELTGKTQDISFVSKRKGDLYWFICNNSKITKSIGWTPSIKSSDGIFLLVKWVEMNRGLFR